MACLFAARLAAGGNRITLLGSWQEALEALGRDGVRLLDLDGCERVYPVRAVSSPEECEGAGLALVLVKSWQTERAAKQLEQCLSSDGLALSLQNGLGNHEILAGVLGEERVVLGTTTAGATLLGPGRVRAGGNGKLTLGSQPRLGPLVSVMQAAGFEVQVVPDVESVLWGKLVINAAINPLSALLRISNGGLLLPPPVKDLMAEAAQEAAAVASAYGIHLPYPDPVAAVEEVALRTAQNFSSMLQDVLRGAPTEIDAISGVIVRLGEQAGLAVPVNRTLWRLVKGLYENSADIH